MEKIVRAKTPTKTIQKTHTQTPKHQATSFTNRRTIGLTTNKFDMLTHIPYAHKHTNTHRRKNSPYSLCDHACCQVQGERGLSKEGHGGESVLADLGERVVKGVKGVADSSWRRCRSSSRIEWDGWVRLDLRADWKKEE